MTAEFGLPFATRLTTPLIYQSRRRGMEWRSNEIHWRSERRTFTLDTALFDPDAVWLLMSLHEGATRFTGQGTIPQSATAADAEREAYGACLDEPAWVTLTPPTIRGTDDISVHRLFNRTVQDWRDGTPRRPPVARVRAYFGAGIFETREVAA